MPSPVETTLEERGRVRRIVVEQLKALTPEQALGIAVGILVDLGKHYRLDLRRALQAVEQEWREP